jgi:hypothetical protein
MPSSSLGHERDSLTRELFGFIAGQSVHSFNLRELIVISISARANPSGVSMLFQRITNHRLKTIDVIIESSVPALQTINHESVHLRNVAAIGGTTSTC